ncbi:efflux RND transporter periplasmic adaptor subunit [Thermodesulfobacteriota bacterium]
MNPKLKALLISVAIVLVGVAGFMILKITKPVPPEKTTARPRAIVRVIDVKKGDFRALIEENGNVEPKTMLDITAEVAGSIIYVSNNLQIGYFVKKGELLLELDPREYRLSVVQAQAQIAQLNAEIDQTAQQKENIRRNLSIEQDKLKFSRSELERKLTLLKSGSLSQSEVDKQQIDTKQKESSVLGQRNALALLKSQQDLIRAKIDATEAQKEMAKLKLEKTKIYAPFRARVRDESVDTGEYVGVGQKLATIYDISSVEIVINLSPRKMNRWVGKGHKDDFPNFTDVALVNEWMRKHGPSGEVSFQMAGGVKTWPCKVTRIKGVLDAATRTIALVVEVKDPFKGITPGGQPPLVPGMFVQVILQGRMMENVAKIPRSAIHDGSVYLVAGGKLEIRKVKIEMMTREDAIISEGLNDGDKVVLSPIAVPIPGTELRIAREK